MDISYTFSHGFASSVSFWEHITTDFPYPYTLWDRGYYTNTPQYPTLDTTLRIGVGHSLGLIHLLQSNIHFDRYIGLQSFSSFIGYGNDAHMRQRSTNAMYRLLQRDCPRTLSLFCKQCSIPYTATQWNEEHILSDYLLLSIDHRHLFFNKKIFLYLTLDDPIVPCSLLLEKPPPATLALAPCSQHALGYLSSLYIKSVLLQHAKSIL